MYNDATPFNMSLQEKEKVIFVQFSDNFLTSDSSMRDYYRAAYSKMDGYYYPQHYMEIPFWIPTVSGMLPGERYEKSLHVVQDKDASLRHFTEQEEGATLLFSVMGANVNYVHDIARMGGNKLVLGGYTDPKEFDQYDHVNYLPGVAQLKDYFSVNTTSTPDYSLFAGEKCIPRLTLSTGCLFRCSFCTVDTALNVIDQSQIQSQVEAFRPLDFKLVFIDDKSFGQASNWKSISGVGDLVKAYNPDFSGFIVQTPPSLALKDDLMEEAVKLGVKYMELGVEVVDDDYLALLKKPYRVKHLMEVSERARAIGLKIIPNFILGIPGHDYSATVDWVADNTDIIPVVNINYLSLHFGNERGRLPWFPSTIEDSDQNSPKKTWLSEHDIQHSQQVMKDIYELTGNKQYVSS